MKCEYRKTYHLHNAIRSGFVVNGGARATRPSPKSSNARHSAIWYRLGAGSNKVSKTIHTVEDFVSDTLPENQQSYSCGDGSDSSPHTESSVRSSWDFFTSICVHGSTCIWTFLMLPPIISALHGTGTPLEVPVQVTVMYAFCYTTLTGVFMDLRDQAASLLNGVGAMLSFCQLFLVCRFTGAALPVLATWAAAAAMLLTRVRLGNNTLPAGFRRTWEIWKCGLAVFGGGLLGLGWAEFVQGIPAAALHFAGGMLFATTLLAGKLAVQYHPAARALADDAPAWAATVLFMLVAAAPLRAGLVLQEEAVQPALCCLLGNALLIPRALVTRDHIFFTGTVSCSLMYWGQLVHFACCAPQVSHRLIGNSHSDVLFLTVAMVVAGWGVLTSNAKALDLRGPLDSITHTMGWGRSPSP
eukprot:jgi/Botrbrau1/14076/Bobra.182_3s0023.1